MRVACAVTSSWPAAALAGLALLAGGCGTASSPQAPGSAPASAKPASAPASGAAASHTPAAASTASPSCRTPASATVYTASGAPGPVQALDAVQFVSASQGWAAGAGRVLVTTDGGRTWTNQYAGPAELDELDFTDAQHGWAVGTNTLLRTTDGGTTWTQLSEPACTTPIEDVHFVTEERGYAVARGAQVWMSGGVPAAVSGGELLTTTDGGSQWTPVAGAPAQAQTVCFSGADDGFLGTPGKVWHSTDGGATWSLAFTEPPLASGVHPPAPDTTVLECAGGNAAWVQFLGYGAALGHAPYLAYATQDARNWRAVLEESYIESGARPEVRAPDGPGSYPGPFSAISPVAAAFVGYTPASGYGAAPVELVTSGGATVTSEGNVGGVSVPEAAAFISPSQGWVVGETLPSGDFVIEVTANSGHTWTRQYQAR
jgi:photosystem II stability/assembly factor-like uncharacterized protein